MPGFNPGPGGQDEKIPTRLWNRIVDAVSRMSKISVQPPLTINYVRGTPVIGIQDGFIRSGLTSSIVGARVGTQMGTGTVIPYRTLSTGNMVPAAESELQCFSKFGASISEGVWVAYAQVDGRWEIVCGDCSGAAPT
jgi:hypothetical protein